MSGNGSDDHGNMSDQGNANGASAGEGKCVWDDMAVSDMYFTAVELRGGFSAAEANDIQARMHAKGYSFTAKQIQTKHKNFRKTKLGPADKLPATAAAKAEPKAKAAPKPRARPAPKVDADGNPVTPSKAKTPRKIAAKPRAQKSTPKKELDDNGDEVEVETDAPPSKKRKAAGKNARKVVVHETVKDEEAEEDDDSREGEAGISKMDVDGSSDVIGESTPAAAAQSTKDSAEADSQKTKKDAASAAEMTKVDAAHAAQMTKVEAQNAEDVALPEEEGDSFIEQMEIMEASETEGDAEEQMRVETVTQQEQTVVQKSA